MLNIFTWLVRWGDNTTSEHTFRETPTGEFTYHDTGPSVAKLNKEPISHGQEYHAPASLRRVTQHSYSRRGTNDTDGF